MREISKQAGPKIKGINKENIANKVISEESLLSLAMAEYSRKVLTGAVERICSAMKGAQSWGAEDGYVRAGLTRVDVKRPRIRCEGKEIEIPEYEKLQSPVEFKESVRRAMLGGLATRQFKKVGEALGNSKGLSKSVVSRVSKSFAVDFDKLMSADCADIVAVFMDGIHFADSCLLAAVGVSQFGGKRLLGLWAGTSESKEIVGSVLDELKNRNLNPKLFIIDGGKALKAAINHKFDWVPIQRCTVHKKRNIVEHVDSKHHHFVRMQMANIFESNTFSEGYQKALHFHLALKRINETAARSWEECMPEILTFLQITDPELRRVFSTTNPIESLFSAIRSITGRVKRWRDQNQILYWCAGSYFRVQPNFRRVRGYKMLDQLSKLRQASELITETSKEMAA